MTRRRDTNWVGLCLMSHSYDVYYLSAAVEPNQRLPDADARIAYVQSTSREDLYLIPASGQWKITNRENALRRSSVGMKEPSRPPRA